MAPEPNKWKHICWWREGPRAYAEAQFFAQIPEGYPILCLGLAIEKGYASDDWQPRAKRMNSGWDWHRLLANSEAIFDGAAGRLAKRLKRPITLRIKTKTAKAKGWELEAYSCIQSHWHHRHEGHIDAKRIMRRLEKIDADHKQWAIVHLACDLSRKEAHGLTAADIAARLVVFDEIRKRVRERP
jgi:hypothetical protein